MTPDERIAALLRNVAENIRPCRACGVDIAMVRHRNGKLAPYTMDGVNHFVNCPKAEQFRTKKEPVCS